jgi:hypothetical protein
MAKGLIGSRGDKRILIKEHTLWSKTEIAVLAFFSKNNNKPTTYRIIARAYVSSSYSNYQKSCEDLAKRGYLERLEDGSFRVRESSWGQIKKGTESFERKLPYFDSFLKKLTNRD